MVLLIVHWLGRKAALQPPQAASKGSQDSTGLGASTLNMQSGEIRTLKKVERKRGVKKTEKYGIIFTSLNFEPVQKTCSW